ncbi:two-component sensor histidine kinase, partial [Stenotrophomonas maltophilia]
LARVNADLLATRALLADSARDAERLRLARELHDVAGHKLTAMRLNLRALAADPVLAKREGLVLAEQLSGELLADIRQVVQSMRDDRGLDLATALHALAAPFPRPKLQLQIGECVRVVDPLMAETVLRLVQEALTNAARHGNADTVWLTINEEDSRLRIDIRDDGQRAERIREGNGIAGMRERLAAVRGQLELARTAQGGMHLTAWVPA